MASQGFLSDSQAMTRAVTGFAECAANAKKAMSDLEADLTQTLSSYAGDQAVASAMLGPNKPNCSAIKSTVVTHS